MSVDGPTPQTPDGPLETKAGPAPAQRQPGMHKWLIRTGTEHAADLVSRTESSLPVRCLRRFAAINGRDRALVLGGQAFTTLIPLLIVVAAVASRQGPTALADRMATRFHVTGASAQASCPARSSSPWAARLFIGLLNELQRGEVSRPALIALLGGEV
jgi:hypothetical protein